MESYTGLEDALESVLTKVGPLKRTESVKTMESAGRIIAEDVIAQADSPEFPTSHMDGFAIVASDTKMRRVELKVVGSANPESPFQGAVVKGEAVRVSTGSRVPNGADAVVPVEHANEKGERVTIDGEFERGASIYQAGSDFRKGDTLLRAGSKLRAQDVALLLALRIKEVTVVAAPKVGVLATGSELYDFGNPSPKKILNTHGPMVAILSKSVGCEPLDLGVVPDRKGELARRLENALGANDIILTLGGTSVGRRDYVVTVVKSFGPEVLIHGLKMDRGRVSGIAVVKGKPIVMLPGPVQAAMNAFLLMVVPIVAKMRGGGQATPRLRAKLVKPWKARPRFASFTKVLYVRLTDEGAEPLTGDTESITILTRASGYVVVPERISEMPRGTAVDVNLFPGS